MAKENIPVVGNWYQIPEQQKFEVVAIDDAEGVVEIQYFSGELDELDFDTWSNLGLTDIPAPEDWTGPYDELEFDDLGYTDMNRKPSDLPFSLDDLED
jgi:hypothetical protein